MYEVEKKEIKGYTVKIIQDDLVESPREWDNLGTVAFFHRNYNLGDAVDFKAEDFSDWLWMEEYIYNELGAVAVLPIYMYDHSGITIKTSPFGSRWDSGRVGFIYCTKDEALKWFNQKRYTEKFDEKVRNALDTEIKILDQYCRGDVYGFDISKNGESFDSCWGYYGSPDSDSHIWRDILSIIDWDIERCNKRSQMTDACQLKHVYVGQPLVI